MLPAFTYIPYIYFLKTRLIGKFQRFSWIFVYFIPVIFLYYQQVILHNIFDYLQLILGVLIVNYVYENGYIENDVMTIKKEKNPTLRLSSEEIKRIDGNFPKLILVRMMIFVVMYFAYMWCVAMGSVQINNLYLLWISVALQLMYLIYNRVRNLINLFLILPLSFVRFFGFILPFVTQEHLWWWVILATLIYPLPKFLEFSSMKRYSHVFNWGLNFNIDRFRIAYYLVLTLLLAGTILLINYPYKFVFLVLAIYFLVYRAAGMLVISNRKVVDDFKTNFNRRKENN